MKKIIVYALLTVTVSSFSLLTGCQADVKPDFTNPPDAESTQIQDIGTGGTVFILEITDNNGTVEKWNVHTDAATVGDALIENNMIDGDVSDFGLLIKYVNGLRADYDEDGAYWAFFIDGEYAAAGADATGIEQGRVYALVYTAA